VNKRLTDAGKTAGGATKKVASRKRSAPNTPKTSAAKRNKRGGAASTSKPKTSAGKTIALKRAKTRRDNGGLESDYLLDIARAEALSDTEVTSEFDGGTASGAEASGLGSEGEGSPSGGTKAKSTGKKPRSKARKAGKKLTAAELEEKSVSGPFSGKIKVLKGDDVQALIDRSRKLPNAEMLAFWQRIWEMCERCARYIHLGTSTPS
jgi:hypothetical protein